MPTLTAGLGLSLPGTCNIPFTFEAPLALFAPPRPVFLALGFGNPAISLGFLGWPGCTLWPTLPTVLAMQAAGSNNLIYVSTLTVPQNPAFIGTTVFAQGLMLASPPPYGGPLALSNGLAVSL